MKTKELLILMLSINHKRTVKWSEPNFGHFKKSSFLFDKIRMHKRISLYGNYGHMYGREVNLINSLKEEKVIFNYRSYNDLDS